MQRSVEFLNAIHESRILIVDDVEVSQAVIEQTLRKSGFKHIDIANNGAEALEQARLVAPDIIILDIQMPVMDGFECCEKFRQIPRFRDTPILVQTVLTQPEMRVKAFMHGATDIVSKPIEPNEFYARVLVHLEKQYCMWQLQEYHTRTSKELDNARALQKAILPDAHDIAEMKLRHHLDVAAHFQPSHEIGGDFWGMKQLFAHQVAFWIVDFSGHGVEGALNAFRLQAYLKEYSPLVSKPGEYLVQLNEKLLELLLIGQFATMFYGILDLQAHRMFYASAGSTHPLIRRNATGKAEMIDGSGLPLGLSIHTYPTQEVPFNPGDHILWYSDALTETPDHAGRFATEADLMQALERHSGSSAEFVMALAQKFESETGGKLHDDLTIVSCKW